MVNTFGVTDQGFVKKSLTDITRDLEANAKRFFGQDVDLTPGSPIKIMIDMFAVQFAGMWTELNNCYKAGFVNTATDASLDSLAALVGVERLEGYKATGEITFFRSTVMPDGAPRIIPAGTQVMTTHINPYVYRTTKSVYFEPTITDEEHVMETTSSTVGVVNIVGAIVSITDSDLNDLTSGATFDGRVITLPSTVNAGKSVFVTYKPLSVTAPIEALVVGSDSNVASSTITVMSSTIDFVHYVSNESGIDSGYDVESDSSLRDRIVGASQSVGKATNTALEYFLGRLPGVTNVTIEDPWQISVTEDITGNGTTAFYVSNYPVHSVESVVGSTSGTMTVDSFNIDTGEVTLTESTVNGETLTVTYKYSIPGNIKIYVEGGTVGDENTADTIVYTIENTRAAGVRCVGYGTGDANAYGSESAPFSWFYRPENAMFDVAVTIYFDGASTMTSTAKETVATNVADTITEYINGLNIADRLYKSKIVQLAISVNSDIVDVQLDSWGINSAAQDVNATYIQGGDMEIPVAQTITVNSTTE